MKCIQDTVNSKAEDEIGKKNCKAGSYGETLCLPVLWVLRVKTCAVTEHVFGFQRFRSQSKMGMRNKFMKRTGGYEKKQ